MTNRELGELIRNWWQDAIVDARDMRGDIPFEDAENLAVGISTDAVMWAEEHFSHDERMDFLNIDITRRVIRMYEALVWEDCPKGFGDNDDDRFNEYIAQIAYLYTKKVIRTSSTLSMVTNGKFFINFGICEMLTERGRRTECDPFALVISEIEDLQGYPI